MRAEKAVFGATGVFFGVVAPVYWLLAREIAGALVLGFSALLFWMIAAFLHVTAKRFDARPEDRPDAEIHEGAGEVGFFAPRSLWPFVVALTATIVILGPALEQWWLSLLGVGLTLWAIGGWVLEYYRGEFRH